MNTSGAELEYTESKIKFQKVRISGGMRHKKAALKMSDIFNATRGIT